MDFFFFKKKTCPKSVLSGAMIVRIVFSSLRFRKLDNWQELWTSFRIKCPWVIIRIVSQFDYLPTTPLIWRYKCMLPLLGALIARKLHFFFLHWLQWNYIFFFTDYNEITSFFFTYYNEITFFSSLISKKLLFLSSLITMKLHLFSQLSEQNCSRGHSNFFLLFFRDN